MGLVRRGTYRDSVQLMRIAQHLRDMPGIEQAEVLMGTESNLEALRRAHLIPPEVEQARPGASDLVIVVAGAEDVVRPAVQKAAEMVDLRSVVPPSPGGPQEQTPAARAIVRSQCEALRRMPDANLALLSIPGPYVRREAMRALEMGLNLMIFSSNVPIADEIALKEEAARRGLLVMGPDCGTALLGGAALGFANAIRRGPIGAVGASGTGLQEVAVLIDRAGSGVSHAIGAGGRDVDAHVAGRSMLAGLALLGGDPSTRAIVLVGKPPHAATMQRVLEQVKCLGKPTVACFLGTPPEPIAAAGALPVETLEEAAVQAVTLADQRPVDEVRASLDPGCAVPPGAIRAEAMRLAATQRFIRGLFSGGTLANEAALVLARAVGPVSGNLTLPAVQPLRDPHVSCGHTIVDLGHEIFTSGRPHPMLEPAMRERRLLAEASDPSTAVILMDFVLGYGAHPDPVGAFVSALRRARDVAAQGGRVLPVVASVCGTDRDPQGRTRQIDKLRAAGAIVAPSNAAAVRVAALIVSRP